MKGQVLCGMRSLLVAAAASVWLVALAVAPGPRRAWAQSPGMQGTGAPAAVTANASPSGPITFMNSRGVFDLVSDNTGACGGATCASNQPGACECRVYDVGPVTMTSFGLVEITLNETLNNTDVHPILTTTSCRPFYGTGLISNKKETNTAPFFATGWSCGAANGSQLTDNAGIYLMPGGSGRWANARGSGTLEYSTDFTNFSGEAIYDLNAVVQFRP